MKEFSIKFTVKLSEEVVLFIRYTTYDKRKKIKHKLIPCHSFNTNGFLSSPLTNFFDEKII